MSNVPPEENNEEVWDEFKWEEFMQEQDRKVDRLMELMEKYKDDPNSEEIIAKEMGWNWLMEDDGEGEGKDASGRFSVDDIEDDDEEEGEAWKSLTGFEEDELEEGGRPYKNLPAFRKAHEFGLRAHRFINKMPEKTREDSDVVDFVSNAMIAAAKMAGGASFHEESSMLGGNIAYCKRGLNAANKSIEALQALRTRKLVDEESYMSLFKDAKEVRDAIALYVVELRDKFRGAR